MITAIFLKFVRPDFNIMNEGVDICTPQRYQLRVQPVTLLKVTKSNASLGVCHVVQMVQNCVKHRSYFTDFLCFLWYLRNVFENALCPQKLF